MSVRLGAIPYLNALPLTIPLKQRSTPFAITYAVPSQCAAELHRGRIDVGLIPSIEYARGPEPYYIVPQVAIAVRGPAVTVRLFWKGALNRIRRVALDLSSRTSAALLRLLLRERFGLEPEFVESVPDLEGMLARADAALLIGDAVFSAEGAGCEELDLGQAWFELTGLPFVFAFWAGRCHALTPEQTEQLVQARDEGRRQAGMIAETFSHSHNAHDRTFYEQYLTQVIRYEFGEVEQSGLYTFYQFACRHGLIPAMPRLNFFARPGVQL